MLSGAKKCVHCGTTLRDQQARAGGACDKAACRRMAELQAHMRCERCGRVWMWAQSGRRTCSDAACRQAEAVEQEGARVRARQAAEAELEQSRKDRAVAYRKECATIAGISNADAFVAVAVPLNSAKEHALPEARRASFRSHLLRVVADVEARGEMSRDVDAIEQAPVESIAAAGLQFAQNNACASCRGSCCRSAGDRAFVGERTIERVMRRNPTLSFSDLVPLYLSYVPPTVLEDGCVYQGNLGCTLAPELRSDTCNIFFCLSLRTFTHEYSETVAAANGASVGAFITAAREEPFEQGTFVANGFVRIVRARERAPQQS